MAATVKNSSWIDYQARRVNFARDHAFGLDFDAAFRKDHAVVTAGNNHAIAFDLAFDLGIFPKNQCLLGDDVAFDVSVDAESSSDLQRTFHGHALVNKAGPLFTFAVARAAWPLPRHNFFQSPQNFLSNGNTFTLT